MRQQALADQGFVLIGWGHTGWAYFFTANPVKTLDDLRRTKIFTSAGDQPAPDPGKVIELYTPPEIPPGPGVRLSG